MKKARSLLPPRQDPQAEGSPSFVSQPGEGRRLQIRAGEVIVREDGSRTQGSLGVFEQKSRPGDRGPVPHFHKEMTEIFIILQGGLRFFTQDEPFQAGAGSFVFISPGTVHSFEADPVEGAHFLIMFSPAQNRIAFFEGLSAAYQSQGGFDPAELTRFMQQHDQFPVDGDLLEHY